MLPSHAVAPLRVRPLTTWTLAVLLLVRSRLAEVVTPLSVPPELVKVIPWPPLPGRTVAPASVPPMTVKALSTSTVVATVRAPAVSRSAASLVSELTVRSEAEVIVRAAYSAPITASSEGPGSVPPQFAGSSRFVPVPDEPPDQ